MSERGRVPVVAEHLKRILDLPALSPSAPFELRHAAQKKADDWNSRLPEGAPHRHKWWEVYPEGHAAAAIFRMWRALGMPLYSAQGDDLPDA